MTRPSTHPNRRPWAAISLALAMLLALAACGGGGGDSAPPPGGGPTPAACDATPRKQALSTYFDDWYFWYRLGPRPDPIGSTSVDAHFQALLYTGTDPAFPADRWSFHESTESFNRLFGDGQVLGYGLFVTGVEVTGRPDLPLHVRYVEPSSPAASAGLVRGDRILSLNGRPVSALIQANDFAVLTPTASGESLAITIASALGERTLTLAAAVYPLVPVNHTQVLTSPAGKRVGYVLVKDMIGQAVSPMAGAMAQFRSAGVSELVLDLRYNGGGLVTVGRDLASLIAGPRAAGQTYATLLHNDKQSAVNNTRYAFTNPQDSLGLPRVYVLTGPRTCSASEQLLAGLQPVVDVVRVGDTTCGKPVGFRPHDDGCGTTYNVVNFESVNGVGLGRYFDGLRPVCAASEDWAKALGTAGEPLLAAALAHADGAGCVAPSAASRAHALSARGRGPVIFDGERPMMLTR